jgi:hypothetical protein
VTKAIVMDKKETAVFRTSSGNGDIHKRGNVLAVVCEFPPVLSLHVLISEQKSTLESKIDT